MKIHLNEEFDSYEVTECDRKFGNQITLDGEILVPLSILKRARQSIAHVSPFKKCIDCPELILTKSQYEVLHDAIAAIDAVIAEVEGGSQEC